MAFETEVTVKLPYKNQNDSDKGYYFSKVSEKSNRDAYFNSQSEDDYYEETYWK